jgi:RHS repeat-associated protein
VITERSNNANDEFYLHKDHQGSTTSITNASGSLVQQFIYDPWGKQYNVHSNSIFSAYSSPGISRGYTGHKMINDMDIIHMNGRTYDPTLGRFLQADPHIQAPMNSQNYNRYSYVLNNPMSYTDPTGYFFSKLWKKVKPFIGAIAAVVVSIYCQGCGATMWNAAMTGAAIGAGSAAINGGNILKGAFTGALAGAAFQQIGANFNGAEGSGFFAEGGLGHIATHGATGGVMSVLQGGKFGHGFLAAGLTKALNINKIIGTAAKDAGLRGAVAAVVGGTISKVTGGKFANGAITAAFAQAFNGESQAEMIEKNALQFRERIAHLNTKYREDRSVIAGWSEELGLTKNPMSIVNSRNNANVFQTLIVDEMSSIVTSEALSAMAKIVGMNETISGDNLTQAAQAVSPVAPKAGIYAQAMGAISLANSATIMNEFLTPNSDFLQFNRDMDAMYIERYKK